MLDVEIQSTGFSFRPIIYYFERSIGITLPIPSYISFLCHSSVSRETIFNVVVLPNLTTYYGLRLHPRFILEIFHLIFLKKAYLKSVLKIQQSLFDHFLTIISSRTDEKARKNRSSLISTRFTFVPYVRVYVSMMASSKVFEQFKKIGFSSKRASFWQS